MIENSFLMESKLNNCIGGIYFPAGILNNHNDFFIDTYNHLKEVDYLCFFDSRGSSLDNDKTKTFTGLLIEYFKTFKKTFFVICRPLNLTVFFSLFNFLNSNDIRAKNLITNMGFVDFTPKKQEITEDILFQKKILFDDIDCLSVNLEKYRLSSGEHELLTYIDINPCANAFVNILEKNFENIYLLETPEFITEYSFSRKRPDAFYAQLKETNIFINRISSFSDKIVIVPSPNVPDDYLSFSYDGVHFTESGHISVFQKIAEKVKCE